METRLRIHATGHGQAGRARSPGCRGRASIRRIGLLALLCLARALPGLAADLECRPNSVGGYDCRGRDGSRFTSRPNVLGGYDIQTPEGRVTSRPNVLGGFDVQGPGGRASARPNNLGGYDIQGPDGRETSRPNVLGGFDSQGPDGRSTSRPNHFGGVDVNDGRSLPSELFLGPRRAPGPGRR